MKTIRGRMCNTGRTLLAQASSSHVVSCKTLMISLISALIFSKINLRFLSASSTPAPLLLFVVTKIFIAEHRTMRIDGYRLYLSIDLSQDSFIKGNYLWQMPSYQKRHTFCHQNNVKLAINNKKFEWLSSCSWYFGQLGAAQLTCYQPLRWNGRLVNKQLLIYTSRRYEATLIFVFLGMKSSR